MVASSADFHDGQLQQPQPNQILRENRVRPVLNIIDVVLVQIFNEVIHGATMFIHSGWGLEYFYRVMK